MSWNLVAQIIALSLWAWLWIVTFCYRMSTIMPKPTGCYVDLKGELHHVTSVD